MQLTSWIALALSFGLASAAASQQAPHERRNPPAAYGAGSYSTSSTCSWKTSSTCTPSYTSTVKTLSTPVTTTKTTTSWSQVVVPTSRPSSYVTTSTVTVTSTKTTTTLTTLSLPYTITTSTVICTTVPKLLTSTSTSLSTCTRTRDDLAACEGHDDGREPADLDVRLYGDEHALLDGEFVCARRADERVEDAGAVW
ncbi:hypothetical protein KC320_g9162, partial [Hortaea werneckii]